MIACSKTVARGWSKIMGETRDVDKDIEPTALGNSEVRSEGDSKPDIHTSKTGSHHSWILRDSFSDRLLEQQCVGQGLGLPPLPPPLPFLLSQGP